MDKEKIKVLIVDDDFITRRILKAIFTPYGDCDIAINGEEAVQAFRLAWKEKNPYDLICLDIMMPEIDGHEALMRIREIEKAIGMEGPDEVKIIMITVLDDPKNVFKAYSKGGATSYVSKPIKKEKIIEEVRNLGLIK